MVKGRGCVRLLLKAPKSIGIGSEILGQDFDRNLAAQARIAGPIHLSHTTGSDRCHDLIGPQSSVRG